MVAYLNREDMNRKLHDCVIMYNGVPCLLKVNQEGQLNLAWVTSIHTSTDKHPAVPRTCIDVSTDKKFSTKLPPLGYVNCERRVYSVRRAPVRRFKVGLHMENIVCETAYGEYAGAGVHYASRHVADMLLNVYPSYEDALKNVREGSWSSCAFTRTLFIGKIGRYETGLYFQGRLIGSFNESTNSFRVPSCRDYSYIVSLLRKHKVPTC